MNSDHRFAKPTQADSLRKRPVIESAIVEIEKHDFLRLADNTGISRKIGKIFMLSGMIVPMGGAVRKRSPVWKTSIPLAINVKLGKIGVETLIGITYSPSFR